MGKSSTYAIKVYDDGSYGTARTVNAQAGALR
jgi:hypothetical protein